MVNAFLFCKNALLQKNQEIFDKTEINGKLIFYGCVEK